MGIYPNKSFTQNADGTVIERVSVPGLVRTRVLRPDPWIEDRTDCFCCSCASGEGGDPFCRNHGFAGARPCDGHGMPGQVDEEGVMPISVQAYRQRGQGQI